MCKESECVAGCALPLHPHGPLMCVGISRMDWEGSCSVNYSALHVRGRPYMGMEVGVASELVAVEGGRRHKTSRDTRARVDVQQKGRFASVRFFFFVCAILVQQCATDSGGIATAFLQISAALPTGKDCLFTHRRRPPFPLDFVAGGERGKKNLKKVPVSEVSGVAWVNLEDVCSHHRRSVLCGPGAAAGRTELRVRDPAGWAAVCSSFHDKHSKYRDRRGWSRGVDDCSVVVIGSTRYCGSSLLTKFCLPRGDGGGRALPLIQHPYGPFDGQQGCLNQSGFSAQRVYRKKDVTI